MSETFFEGKQAVCKYASITRSALPESPFHHVSVLSALASHGRAIAMDRNGDVVLAIFDRRDRGIWSGLLGAHPIVATSSEVSSDLVASFLMEAKRRLGARALYFPAVYADTPVAKAVIQVEGIASWRRAASLQVDWQDDGATLWSRVVARGGSQAERRRKRFERAGLVYSLRGEAALEVVTAIDRASWKREEGRAIGIDRIQTATYSAMLKCGIAVAHIAEVAGLPIAYRLDARLGEAVWALKWSYREEAARFSPGFYLVTMDLARTWSAAGIANIDLCGGVDTLKALIATHGRQRDDFAWPSSEITTELAAERLAHDGRAENAFREGVGLRRFYSSLSTGNQVAPE